MQAAQSMCIIRDDVDAAALGRQIFVSYSGALSLWCNDRLDDDGFSTVARHGLLTALAAAATDDHRDRFLAEMYTTGQRLEQISWRT
jgi:hypothetical protein